MANNIINISDYSPKATDVFLFDNNIWMYLFCPLADFKKNKQEKYSSFLSLVKTVNSTIFINSLILSEFSNAYLRMEFEQWKKREVLMEASYKKDFVGNQCYKDTIKEIIISLKKILSFCIKSPDDFNAINLEAIYDSLYEIDFNDSYYLEISKMKSCKIVTDDYDFQKISNYSLDILTASI